MKLLRKFSTNSLAKAMRVVVLAAVVLCISACSSSGLKYKPWADLSDHFDLDRIAISNNVGYFNTNEISRGKEIYTRQPIQWNAYMATVLGKNVLLRSRPIITASTRRGSVNTGDIVEVISTAEYQPANGKWWNQVRVLSGRCQGFAGYICNDYLISQEKYEAFVNYIFPYHGSNINVNTESKYLNSISDVLLKLEVNERRPRLTVNVIDVKNFGYKLVVAFQIRDLDMTNNNSLLAFIEFANNSNDFRVLGVVPGHALSGIMQMADGSYDIQYLL